MATVCVIGGGTAGLAAAREAALQGADVTLLEGAARVEPPSATWPSLILGRGGQRAPSNPTDEAGVRVMTGVGPVALGGRRAIMPAGGSVKAESFVVATGSEAVTPSFPGVKKKGVMVLDSARSYAALGDGLDEVSHAVVTGGLMTALEVSEAVLSGGAEVTLCLPGRGSPGPPTPVAEVVTDAAAARGVALEPGPMEEALGAGKLEAVLLAGRVSSCDLLAFVPRRVPRPPSGEGRRGPGGGLAVDGWLRTSARQVYAAGSCAELEGPGLRPLPLADSAYDTGRVAGANAVGRTLSVTTSQYRTAKAFGVRWWQLDALPGVLGPSGKKVCFSKRWGSTSACSIAFDRASGSVLGVEVASPDTAGAPSPPLGPPPRTTLYDLAYARVPSTDISVISETARQAIERWRRS